MVLLGMVEQEIRVCILYEFKLKHNASEASRNINAAWGEGSLSERAAQMWFKKFRGGDLSLQNKDRGRPPSLLN